MIGNVVCDVCNSRMRNPEGYLLTTTEVVASPEYWKHYYQVHKDEFSALGVKSYKGFDKNQAIWCAAILMQETPWIICKKCISMFEADRDKTSAYAKKWWKSGRAFKPPGTGPAPLSAIKM